MIWIKSLARASKHTPSNAPAGARPRAVAVDSFGATAAPALPPPGLHEGMHGDAVRRLQSALVNLGVMTREQLSTGPGIFGPRTLRALRLFQEQHHLGRSGVFTAQTRSSMAEAIRTAAAKHHTPRPDADHGTPFYNQHDPRWRNHRLGRRFTIGNAGCAMTATAMALSRISGRRINPAQLDRWLDRHHGYWGDGIIWARAAAARGLKAGKVRWKLSAIDQSLRLGKPVVIGVDYKRGDFGGANGTDHWITVTARRRDSRGHVYYLAHDPGSGRRVRLYRHGRVLKSPAGTQHYISTGQLVVFRRRR
ncbi:MAG: peptidoglycan-binding protein [Archangiaceae bacterium]|nr:peptidoglycan-binding protein [Archangiaceae bacterium]